MSTEYTAQQIEAAVAEQRDFFRSRATLDTAYRREMLRRLAEALDRWEQPLCDALAADLHKSREEAYMTELSIVRDEIRYHLRHLRGWARPQRRRTPLKMFPSRSRIVVEPLGVALIVSPWNYPVQQLLLNPLVAAVSAGCTAVLKPSPHTPHVSETLAQMISRTFDRRYITVIEGGREVNTMLFEQRYDIIFFTGSPSLGRVVMQAAARHPHARGVGVGRQEPPASWTATPTYVSRARRIAWGKTLNAGQTCIAPDYLLIHRSVKQRFVEEFAAAVRQMHGDDPQQSPHYVRMVDDAAFRRVVSYLDQGRAAVGGRSCADDRYIEPTLLDDVAADAAVMREEIFGPVLPMIGFDDIAEAVRFIAGRERPLALYYFGQPAAGREVVRQTSSGGACINDTIMHIANHRLPFGGVGNSGMGAYHGRTGFEAFAPPCRRHDTHGIRSAVPLYAPPNVPLD